MTVAVPLEEGIRESREKLGLEPDHEFELGVLLVHGIGEQMRGDTLTEEGDHIFRWLRRRVVDPEEADGARVDVAHVVARQRSADQIETAHAVVRITPPTGKPAEWIVAESWWADVFRPATFAELAGWGVTVGPWVFATQVAGITRRMEIGADVPRLLGLVLIPITLLTGIVMLLGAAVIGLLVTAAAIAVVLLAITRIPLLADLARSVQRGLAGGFGDAYILTRSPVRFGAMATQVRSDLEALLTACGAVAVLAHSQGAAVAWYAVKHELLELPANPPGAPPRRTPLGLFVTYGQGLRKLAFALTMARGAQKGYHGVVALGSAGFLALAVLGFVVGAHPALIVGLVAVAIGAEALLVSLARPIWDASGQEIGSDWASVIAREPTLQWLDLWGSADPAPVGPLDVPGERIRSYKIRNLASTLFDHFVYWQNTTEFLAIVASRLFGLGGPQRYAAELSDPRLQVAAMRRHARVMQLLAMRVVVVGGVLAGLVHAWQTPSLGATVVDWVANLNLPFVDGFFDAPPDWAVALAGYVAIVVLGLVAWAPITVGWNSLMGMDETTYFSGLRRPLWTLPWFGLGALAIVIGGTMVGLLSLAGSPAVAGAYVFGAVFAALLFLTVLGSGGSTFAGAEDNQDVMAAASKITGRAGSSLLVAGLIAAVLAAAPIVAWLVRPDALGPTLAVESVMLSVVLAVEGIREYRLFSTRFNDQNAKLPADGAGSRSTQAGTPS